MGSSEVGELGDAGPGRRGRVLSLYVISGLRGVRDNLRMVVWQPFALSLGVEVSSIGALESTMDLSRLALEPAFGDVSDSFGRRRLMILRELLVLASGLLFLFAGSWHLLFAGMVLVGVSMSLFSVWNAVIAESAEPGRLGYIYGVVGTCYTGAGLLGTLGAGLIAEWFGYGWVYIAVTGFSLLTLLVVWLRLHETGGREGIAFSWLKTTKAIVGTVRPPGYLRAFYIAMGLDLLAFGIGLRILYGMLAKGYGYTPFMLGLLATAMTGAHALAQMPLGKLADRAGYSRFLAASQLLATVSLAMLVVSKGFEVALASMLLLGVANAFWMPAEQAWIAANVDPSEMARALGSFNTFRSLWGFPAPLVGGLLFDAFGFDAPVLVNLVLAAVDGVMILALVKDRAMPRTAG